MSFQDAHNSSSGTAGGHRLARLTRVPSIADLDNLLSECRKSPNGFVEIPWQLPHSVQLFTLSVSLAQDPSCPTWILQIGEGDDTAVAWSHESADTTLIQTLILAESDPARISSSVMSMETGAYAAQPQYVPSAQGAQTSVQPRKDIVLPPPVELDRVAIDAVKNQMCDLETHFFSHGSFLFLLVREFARFRATRSMFSVVVFDMLAKSPATGVGKLSGAARRTACERISASLGELDIAGHYGSSLYALLLPNRSVQDAQKLASDLHRSVLSSPLSSDAQEVALFFGVASLPEITDHPGVLLAAADQAMQRARDQGTPVLVYGA